MVSQVLTMSKRLRAACGVAIQRRTGGGSKLATEIQGHMQPLQQHHAELLASDARPAALTAAGVALLALASVKISTAGGRGRGWHR